MRARQGMLKKSRRQPGPWRRFAALSGTAVVVLALSACVAKRDDYATPDVPLPETFLRDPAGVTVETQTVEAQSAYLREILPQWWHAFGSSELNSLVERALVGNGDLRMAALRVVQAHALMGQEEANLYPQLDAVASAAVDAPKDGTGTVAAGRDPESERTFRMGLELTWSPDIWGEYSAAAEAEAENLRAAIFARDQIRSTIIAQTVQAYLRYLSLSDRLRTARGVTETMIETLDSLKLKLRDRDTTALRVAQQESVTYASIAAIPDLEVQREQAHDELAFLMGTVPEAVGLQGETLVDLRLPPVPQGLPPHFILRRPDVQEAEALLLAADADIDVARARVLPPLDLSAGYGYGATYLNQLFTPENLAWNLLARLTATIFDAGQRELAVTQNRARHQELVESYVQTVYQAVREVEDALSAQTHLARRLAAQETSVGASEVAFDLSRQSHDFGTVDYLTVLDANRTYLRSLDDLHQIRLARYAGMVEYFTALGGGATLIDPDQDAADDAGEAASDVMEEGGGAHVVGVTTETVAAEKEAEAEAEAEADTGAGAPALEGGPAARPGPDDIEPAPVTDDAAPVAQPDQAAFVPAVPAVAAPNDLELTPVAVPPEPEAEPEAAPEAAGPAPRWVQVDGVWRAAAGL